MRLVLACMAALWAGPLFSQSSAEVRTPGEIVVYGRSLPQIGITTSGSQGTVGYRNSEHRPLARIGGLVENAPGVIATHVGTSA